jgi:hypothetical protein
MAAVVTASWVAVAQDAPSAVRGGEGGSGPAATAEGGAAVAEGDAATVAEGGGTAAPTPRPPNEGQRCMEAFGRSQRLRRKAKLLDAREQLLICAQASCLDVLRTKCAEWLEEVEADVPSLVVAITDRRGQTPTKGRVVIDGERVPIALRGRAVDLDPGRHVIEVKLPDGEAATRSITMLQGQKNQSVVFDFEPPPPPLPEPAPVTIVRDRGNNVPALVAFSIGGAALVAGIITGALAFKDESDLNEQCDETGCTQAEIDNGLALAHASTATFAIAGVAAVLGVTFLFVFDDDDDGSAALTLSPTGGSLRVHF